MHITQAVFYSMDRKIAESFGATGMEYFNTFGGNPVSAAVANAVLDVIENEKLLENATLVGRYLLQEFNRLKEKHCIIGKEFLQSETCILRNYYTINVMKY